MFCRTSGPLLAHKRRLVDRHAIDSVATLSSRFASSVAAPASGFCLPNAAPLPAEPPRSIVFGSCSSQKEDLSYWSTILNQNPDLILLLGDNIYGGQTAASLWQAYTQFSLHDAFREAYATIPILATLDDNDYGCGGKNSNNSSHEQAKTMFCDFWQVPASDERRQKGRGVYSSYTWGDELQIIMLDIRFHQSEPFRKCRADKTLQDPAKVKGPFLPSDDPTLTFLGEAQWWWLREQFQVPVKRRILVSPIQVLAVGHQWDCWNLFLRERKRLLQLLRKECTTGDGTLILSGDRHFSAFYQHENFVEVTSSSLTHSCPKGLFQEEDSTRLGGMIFENNFGMIHTLDAHDGDKVVVSIRNANTGELCEHPYNPLVIK